MTFFTSKIVEKVQSSFNGEIKVVSDFGKLRLVVGGLTQSEGLTKEIWEKGIKKVASNQLPVASVLILGLGGGTVVGVINKYFPQVKIIAIEIDPLMVELGKKYFGLKKYKNLKIINADAFKIINHQSSVINHPDLIIVDLFIGENMPQKSTSLLFFRSLKKLLSNNGILLINRLFYPAPEKTPGFCQGMNRGNVFSVRDENYSLKETAAFRPQSFHKTKNRNSTEKLIANLNKIFGNIELIRCKFNLLVLCQK